MMSPLTKRGERSIAVLAPRRADGWTPAISADAAGHFTAATSSSRRRVLRAVAAAVAAAAWMDVSMRRRVRFFGRCVRARCRHRRLPRYIVARRLLRQ